MAHRGFSAAGDRHRIRGHLSPSLRVNPSGCYGSTWTLPVISLVQVWVNLCRQIRSMKGVRIPNPAPGSSLPPPYPPVPHSVLSPPQSTSPLLSPAPFNPLHCAYLLWWACCAQEGSNLPVGTLSPCITHKVVYSALVHQSINKMAQGNWRIKSAGCISLSFTQL